MQNNNVHLEIISYFSTQISNSNQMVFANTQRNNRLNRIKKSTDVFQERNPVPPLILPINLQTLYPRTHDHDTKRTSKVFEI